MRIFQCASHVFGGTLLIAATTIGVGMLALPVATGESGFIPSIIVYIICWLFMLCTGLLMLEVCQWMPKNANLITMSETLLGNSGKVATWLVYLFLFVTVMIAHIAGGGDVIKELFHHNLPSWLPPIMYVIIFSPIVYLGTKWVDRVNLLLMTGVLTTYLLFIFFSYDEVQPSLLSRANWSKSWLAIPILFTAFTYQVIIPTLMNYMDRNVKKVKLSLVFGTTIPLIIYIIWEWLILGIIPEETLIETKKLGQNAVWPLQQITKKPAIIYTGKAFAFFTMTTSYLALALAFHDFLSDGLRKVIKNHNQVLLCALVFFPPLVITMINPNLFLIALSYAGGFSCAFLFGLLPPLMVWAGRYHKKYADTTPLLFGGRITLSILIFFMIIELGIEVIQLF